MQMPFVKVNAKFQQKVIKSFDFNMQIRNIQ